MSMTNRNGPLSQAEFLALVPKFEDKVVLMRDPYFETQGVFVGVRYEGGGTYLVVNQLLRRARFTANPFMPFHRRRCGVLISEQTLFSLMENGQRCYVALAPGVNHMYLG